MFEARVIQNGDGAHLLRPRKGVQARDFIADDDIRLQSRDAAGGKSVMGDLVKVVGYVPRSPSGKQVAKYADEFDAPLLIDEAALQMRMMSFGKEGLDRRTDTLRRSC